MTERRTNGPDPAARLVVAGLHTIAVALLLLHWYVRTLPPTTEAIPPPDSAEAAWWGLWPITYLPAPAFWTGVVVVLALVEWGWLPNAWTPRTQLHPSRRHLVWLLIPSLLLLVAFFASPIVHTRWGDAYILSRTIAWPDSAVRLTHSWQAPLDVFLHSRVWLALHNVLNWEDAVPVYRLLSPIAGAIYLATVVGLCASIRAVGRLTAWQVPLWLVYLLLVSSGVIQLFFGYIENYSFAAAGILLFLWLGQRTLARKTPLWLTALVLALTNATHPSTIVLAPALLYVGWRVGTRDRAGKDAAPDRADEVYKSNGTSTPVRSVLSRTVPATIAIIVPMVLVAAGTLWLMEAGGHGIDALLTSDRPGGGDARWFVPLWATRTRWEAYTLLSWPHLRDMLNQQMLVAPIVLPSLLWLALWRRFFSVSPVKRVSENMYAEPQRSTRHFWMIAAVCHMLLITVWNPDYGGQRDWDLFSLAAIATTLWLIATLHRDEPERWRHTLSVGFAPLLALQIWHTAAWVYQNTLPWAWP